MRYDVTMSKNKDGDKDDKGSGLQTIVQLNVYRFKNDAFQFLLFKRAGSDHDSQFWQPMSEPLGKGETIADGLQRIAKEHAGIRNLNHMSHSVYSYDWYSGDESGRDIVFAAQVEPTTPILPDIMRYSTFEWLSFGETLARLKWSGSKEAIRQLQANLDKRINQLSSGADDKTAGERSDETHEPREQFVDLHEHESPSKNQDASGSHHRDPDQDAKRAKPTPRETNLLDGLPRAYDPDQDNDGTSVFPL